MAYMALNALEKSLNLTLSDMYEFWLIFIRFSYVSLKRNSVTGP
jgi:hypothetical protein